ncbi:MAG TPA: RagB/SusD family nutrient uptake outer membrane protein [Chitinophagaceae bacterium]|nr:RagB/SusD family nutrient uptake outer membrane protein [Chitinophagaceae bacterium]
MKKIKRILWSILILAIPMLFMVSGCSKFLDRKPLTATLDDLNQGGIEGLVFGIYSAVKDYDIGQVFGGIPWQGMHNFRSDDSHKGSEPSDGAEWVAPFDEFKYVKDLWASNFYWDAHYSLIHLTNTALQTADSLGLTGAESEINLAEARFFRAFSYFDLVRTYGDVPKIDFRIYNAAQANIAKSPASVIYALIDADLQYAATHLPLVWGSKYPGRLTSGAAKSLWAKTYLFRGNFSAAIPLLQQVVGSGQYSLFASYFGIFKDAGENSSESILEWQNYMGPNRTDDHGSWYATCQGVRAPNATGWNLGWGWNVPTEEFVTSFEAGDPRLPSTVLFSGQSDDPATGGYGSVLPRSSFDVPPGPLPQKYWNKKVYADPAVRQSTGWLDGAYWINQRVIRYADVLLMLAECLNETGNGTLAADYLNQVRDRVGLAEISFVDQPQLRTAIKKERRAELGLEGERFFDLVRWGDAVTVLGPLGYQHRCRFYPIPQPAIDRSNNVLVQNPEW